MENLCIAGTMCERECHLTTYSKTAGIDLLLEMEPDSREILMWETGVTITNNNATVCFHHKYVFIKQYPLQQQQKKNTATHLVCIALQRKTLSLIGHKLYLKQTLMQI